MQRSYKNTSVLISAGFWDSAPPPPFSFARNGLYAIICMY
jgi:hypothetical protein